MYGMRMLPLALAWLLSAAVLAQDPAPVAMPLGSEDVVPGVPFQAGDVLTFEQLDKLKDYLPPPFWEHREYFFYEGMELTIGPFHRKYGEADAYSRGTKENRGKTALGRDGSLEGYSGGMPFPNDEIDCEKDPDAATKIIWNFTKAWNGDGAMSNWSYTYWDRGEQLPLYYEGWAKSAVPGECVAGAPGPCG